jgi:ubiquitin C-terminal hydrolase
MSTIETMNSLFKKGQAGDSKDFIIYILEQFHKEFKKPVQFFNNNNVINQPLNQYDQQNTLWHFFHDFQKDCSVISDLFFGINETTNECLYCQNSFKSQGQNNPICYTYGIFNCLIFPLEEVKEMKNKINNNNIYWSQNNRVSLYDCFIYNQKTEHFTGENMNYCNICKQTFDSLYTTRIYSSPIILILILNRGKNNIFNVKLYFNEIMDITQYVVCNNKNKWIYNLYGVITHMDQSGSNAYYVASCKSPVDNKWYRYNDDNVTPIIDLQKEVIDFGTPSILFYRKNDKLK